MVHDNIDFRGKKWVVAEKVEKDARILSTSQIAAIKKKFRESSNLNNDQFVVSSFAYPVIPKPEKRTGYNQIRLAPKNVAKKYFGHPIYWIESHLTERRDDEPWQYWAIRMFYTIEALGYWNDDKSFVDFLEIAGFSFKDSQIETYHNISDLNAETNAFSLLNEGDFKGVTIEDIEEKTRAAVKRYLETEERENIKILQKQAESYAFAKNILGEGVLEWTAGISSKGSHWNTKIFPRFLKIGEIYDKRAEEGDTTVSDLLKETRKNVQDFKEVIMKMNSAASILFLPIQAASRSANPASISLMSTLLSMANAENVMKNTKLKAIDDAVQKAITDRGNIGVGGYDDVIQEVEKIYRKAWERLRFHFVNYNNYQSNKPVYATLVEMNSDIQKQSLSQSSSLESILGDDF